MRVQKAVLEGNSQIRWLVIDKSYLPVKPIQQYLFFLENCSKSPLTLRTYAFNLKIYWEYLSRLNLTWTEVNIDTISDFVIFLKTGTSNNVIHVEDMVSLRSERTINQIITSITSFYDYHYRLGTVKELPLHINKNSLHVPRTYKPLLHHISKSKPIKSSYIKLKEKKSVAKTMSAETVQRILECCKHKRDKFLIALLYETGCRIGQALGLKHEDIESFNNIIRIVPRDNNPNQARAKTRDINVVHVSKELMALYFDYFMEEYAEVSSDYVFINIWGGSIGQPITYITVNALFKSLSKKLNIQLTPHMLRHTHATELLKAGWNTAHVQKRLGHRNIQTTVKTYIHLNDEDAKKYFQEYIEKRKNKWHKQSQ